MSNWAIALRPPVFLRLLTPTLTNNYLRTNESAEFLTPALTSNYLRTNKCAEKLE